MLRRFVGSAAFLALLAAPIPALPADPDHETVAVSSLDAALMRQLASIVGQGPNKVGIGVREINGSREVVLNGQHAFPMASTMKIAVAATYLQGVDEGRFRLSDAYPLRYSTRVTGSDGRVVTRAGDSLTAQSLIELMITRSSNQATDALLEAVGGPRAVNAWLTKAGITGQRIDRDIATLLRDDLEKNDPTLGVDRRDSSTPRAMVQLLSALHQGEVLSPASRALLLGAMSRCMTGRTRIPAGVPTGTLVAHKTGTLYNQTSDVGIIRMPGGRDVAVAVFVTGPGTHSTRARQIAEITRAVYDSYSVQYASAQSVQNPQNTYRANLTTTGSQGAALDPDEESWLNDARQNRAN